MPGLRLKVGDTIYEVGPLTLGEHRQAKRIYGVADMSDLLVGDPDAVAAFIFTAMRRDDKATAVDTLVDRIDGLDLSDVEISDPDAEDSEVEADPTTLASDTPDEAGDADAVKPKPAKPRKKDSQD